MRPFLRLGSWNTVCDICGFEFKAESLKKDWRGLMVCPEDFELRNPQDFIRVRPERVAPPWSRPSPPPIFIDVPYSCTLEGSSGVAGRAIAGCAIVGTFNPSFIPGSGTSAIAGLALAGNAITGTS